MVMKSTFKLKGGDLFENGKKLTDDQYYRRAAVTMKEHRAHALAQLAFHHGEDAVNECVTGFDRTGLPDSAWLWKRELANCGDLEAGKLTKQYKWALSHLSDKEWRHFNARCDGKRNAELFNCLDTLWMRGWILRAQRPEVPQIWFRLAPEET